MLEISCCRITRETADTHDFMDKRKEMFEFVEHNGLYMEHNLNIISKSWSIALKHIRQI